MKHLAQLSRLSQPQRLAALMSVGRTALRILPTRQLHSAQSSFSPCSRIPHRPGRPCPSFIPASAHSRLFLVSPSLCTAVIIAPGRLFSTSQPPPAYSAPLFTPQTAASLSSHSSAQPASPAAAAASSSPSSAFDLSVAPPPPPPEALSLAVDSATTLPAGSFTLLDAFHAAAATAFSPLNDSWLPVKALQFFIDFIHLGCGLPWWLSIVAATLAIRLALFPVFVLGQRNSARLMLMRPELNKATEEMQRRSEEPNAPLLEIRLRHRERAKALYAQNNASPLRMFIVPLVTVPVFLSFFSALRGMQELYPSYTAGGFGFLLDLSAPDPYMVLPILNAACMILHTELQPLDPSNTMAARDQQRMRLFFRIGAVAFVFFGRSFPAGLFFYWITNSLITVLQALAFRSPAVHRLLRIPDFSHVARVAAVMPWRRFQQQPETQPPPAGSAKEAVVLRNEKVSPKDAQQPPQMFVPRPTPPAAPKTGKKGSGSQYRRK